MARPPREAMRQRETSPDPNRLIAALTRDRVGLELKTLDLCYLAALYLRADHGAEASFEEDVLVDLFVQTCDVVEPDADNPRKRATHAIQKLRDQRLLARVDGAGLVRAGDFALTRLAAAIVEYFLADETLTRESLTLLTGTLRAQLAEVLAAARRAESEDDWRTTVVGPLRVTVADMVAGIARRQRGLDSQQEEVQAQIARMLQADWFSAVDECQALLETTTATLRELNEVLLRDTSHFLALLQDIQTVAAESENYDAEQSAQRVIEQVDLIAVWGETRQKAWSGYYQHVHRYLRDVVRLDPDRALSQRLRDQCAAWPSRPFSIVVAHSPSIKLLRPLEARVDRPAVTRPRAERESTLDEVGHEDLLGRLEYLVRHELGQGVAGLGEVTAAVLEQLPDEVHYKAIGRITEAVAALARTRSERERPWVQASPSLELEDWITDDAREIS